MRASGKVGYSASARNRQGNALGVYCVAGPDLIRRIEDARNDDEMVWRYALIRTVLDWYRTGTEMAAPLSSVAELMPLVGRLEDRPLKEDIDDALEVYPARNRTGSRVGRALSAFGCDSGPAAGITVHDYVLDYDHQDQKRALIDEVWSAALQAAPDDSALFRIGLIAYTQNKTNIALNEMKALARAVTPWPCPTSVPCSCKAISMTHVTGWRRRSDRGMRKRCRWPRRTSAVCCLMTGGGRAQGAAGGRARVRQPAGAAGGPGEPGRAADECRGDRAGAGSCWRQRSGPATESCRGLGEPGRSAV